MVFGLLNVDLDKGDNKICWQCASKPHTRTCVEYVEKSKADIINEDDVDTDTDDYDYNNNAALDNNNYNNNSKSLDEM